MKQLSVTDYAISINMTSSAIRWQIRNGKLPENVKAKKIGATYIIEILD